MLLWADVIRSVIHKGLKELFLTNKTALIAPALQPRCKRRLDALHAATDLMQLNLAGFSLHQLRGKPVRFSMHVNGPWTITFEWEAPNASRVDFEQYH